MKTSFLREVGSIDRRGHRPGTFVLEGFSKGRIQGEKDGPVSGSSVDSFGGRPRARGTPESSTWGGVETGS
ncbi:MAG: hypothetical protein VYA53_09450 [Acidobacteriota bacterium]|nr:hypothetical protein [Acidobacteriota bacterium]